MSGMIFGVFLSNSENLAARSVECVCYQSSLTERYRIFFPLILCFVDRASRYISIHLDTSRYICVIKTNLMHYLPSLYFVNKPLHVSGILVAHHQEVYCIYTAIGTCCAFQLTVCWPV